jgi:uncharacterized protein
MSTTPLNLKSAQELLFSKMQNQNLRRHCIGVGKVLAEFYDFYKSQNIEVGNLSRDDWEVVGTLHDADYEYTKDDFTKHVPTLIEWLNDYEMKPEILDALKTHNSKIAQLKNPETLLEWTLECADELSGFIVAVALILPEKKLAGVTIESVLKKLAQPAFARAVDRTQITQCQEKVNLPLDKFVEITLQGMQKNSEILGL